MKFEYNTNDYIRKINNSNSYFNTFLNKENLAAGLLVLKPGEEDTQLPHESDEMYYILDGDGFLKIKNKDYSVKKGKVFFVPKNLEHYSKYRFALFTPYFPGLELSYRSPW